MNIISRNADEGPESINLSVHFTLRKDLFYLDGYRVYSNEVSKYGTL